MGIHARVGRAVDALPSGDSLSAASWQRRHVWICRLLWAHVVAVPLYGIVTGWGVAHALLEPGPLLGGAAVAATTTRLPDEWRAVVTTTGLAGSSAVLVHFSGGLIEMHFHFFVVVVVVSLYQSWRPFLAALGVVVLHHGVAGAIDPTSVYNHPAAIAAPWRWAMVHGGFILAESVACLVAWRLNEDALEGERSAQRALEQVRDDLTAAQQLAGVGSWDWDLTTDAVSWSDELYRIAAVPRDPPPTVDRFLALVHPEDREGIARLLEQARAQGEPLDFECRLVRADGTGRSVHVLGEFERAQDGEPVRLFGTCQDVTRRRALEQEIEHRAFYDGLTGLANRALLLDRLDHALAVGRRTGTPTCVVYLDLDSFKAVNDNLGHRAGDELLVAVARRLEAVVRESDTVARFGGDEFVLLLENTDVASGEHLGHRLLTDLAEPVPVCGRTVDVAASIGVAGTEDADDADDADELLLHADLAMYRAKRQVSRALEVFRPGMADEARARAELEDELRHAVTHDELVLHHQPIVDLQTGELVALEALVRWQHPHRGLLPPAAFIQLAEETGQITELGAWVTREATRQAAELQQVVGHPVHISVNVAAPQFDSDLVGMVRACLDASGLPPSQLTLEITETCLVARQDQTVPQLEALRSLGVRVAIDDFGTGYSSLEYLRQLPIDVLKIDRAFVQSIDEGPEESALGHAIIRLAGIFGLRTVAEGIETAAQAETLRRLGCEHGQGFLYARPRPADALLADARWAVLGPDESTATRQPAPTAG